MEVDELIGVFTYVFVFSNALMLGLLFLTTKSENKKANIYLGLFLWCIVVQIFNDFLGELPIEEDLGRSLFIVESFLFALPFLFFYMHATINKKIENWHYLLFIPGIFHNVLLHFDGLFLTEDGMTIFETIFYFLEIVLMAYTFRVLRNHKNDIADFYSDLEHKSLTWLKRLFILVILIHLFSVITIVFDLSKVDFLEYVVEYTSFGLLVFMIFWIAHNGFSQPEIFKQQLFLASENHKIIETKNLDKVRFAPLEEGGQESLGINERIGNYSAKLTTG